MYAVSKLRNVNLNLLPILRELLRTRNVTRTAEALSLSQPAISDALGRLRKLFQDDILVPAGRGLTTTPFVDRLLPYLGEAIQRLEELLALSPSSAKRRQTSSLRAINLNLLPVLSELLRKRSVTRAAEALGTSQPAVSQGLSRLRKLFHDEILVPRERRLTPTLLATRLEPLLEASIHQLEAIIPPHAFDPAQIRGAVSIATADYVVLMFGTQLAAKLKALAPGLALHFREASSHSTHELRRGRNDFIIFASGAVGASLEGFEQEVLFEDDIVCVVRAGRSAKPLMREEFLTSRYVAFSAGGDTSSTFGASYLREIGAKQFNAISVPSYLLLPFFAKATDSLALVPRRLAMRLAAAAAVRILDPPVAFPKMRIVAAWSRANTHDPAHIWIRGVMHEVAHGREQKPPRARRSRGAPVS